MIKRFVKIFVVLTSFIFLTGFLPILSFIGPGLTIISSGSVYKAGAQYAVNATIKKKKATTKALFFFSLFVVLFSLPKKKNNLKISITKVASLHHSFLENGSVLLDAV